MTEPETDVPGGSPPPLDQQMREVIERMRSPRARHAEVYRGPDVVDANTVDDWADELSALVDAEAAAAARNLNASDAPQEARRYSVRLDVDFDGDPVAIMVLDPDGAFVRFEDVAAGRLSAPQPLLETLRAEAAEALAEQLAASVQTLQQERDQWKQVAYDSQQEENTAFDQRDQAVAERSALRQRCEALAAKWRESAATARELRSEKKTRPADRIAALEQEVTEIRCADQLDAALAVGRSPEASHHD